MAGMDWFRWHHGSVNDPKFQLVARKSGASVAEVLAVWACLLEAASQAEERGNVGAVDFEALDCSLGLDEGRSQAIYERITERDLVTSEGVIAAWDKRQPKREREDDKSTERVKAFRDRQRQEAQCNADETPRNASETPETPREEKSREEIKEVPTVLGDKPAASRPSPCPTEQIVGLYHDRLPMLPRVEVLNDQRKRAVSARWREVVTDKDIAASPDARQAAIEFFDWYFDHASKSRFLTGKAKPWRADFDFLMTPAKFAKVVEGHYHKELA